MPIPILAAMAVGAGVGALAGVAVYGAKVLFSKEKKWNWKDAGAHAAGGFVGGGLFPPIMAGLAAVGLPAAAAYVAAGGIAWGGIWSAAQDATSWALGRRKGMGSPGKYAMATAIGVVVSATLLPFASRMVGPGMHLRPHAGTTSAYLKPPGTAANLLKAEGEFLAYGAMSETITEATTAGTRALLNRGTRSLLTDGVEHAAGGATTRGLEGMTRALSDTDDAALGPTLPADRLDAADAGESPAFDTIDLLGPPSPFGRWALRAHDAGEAALPSPDARLGALQALELYSDTSQAE